LLVVAIILYTGKARSVPVPSFYSGVVEATEHKLGFERAGLIEVLDVEEGDQVEAGQLLAQLDSQELQAKLDAAEAVRASARLELQKLQAGSRPQEIETQRARLSKAKADLERLQNGPTAQQLAQASARMEQQRESYQKVKKGFRAEDVAAARAQQKTASFELKTAETDAQRFEALHRAGAVPAQRLDQALSRLESARGNFKTANENLRKLESGYQPEDRKAAYQGYQVAKASYEDLLAGTRPELIAAAQSEVDYWSQQLSLAQEGPRREDIKSAAARVKKAEAEVQALRVLLSKSKLYSPVAGVVTARPFESGEMVAAGPAVFTVAELEKPWVAVFVPETEIGTVQLGTPCRVTVDSLPGESIDGQVSWISENAEFTPRFIQTERQRVDLVFRVKVRVDNPELKLKPGMPADVRVLQGKADE